LQLSNHQIDNILGDAKGSDRLHVPPPATFQSVAEIDLPDVGQQLDDENDFQRSFADERRGRASSGSRLSVSARKRVISPVVKALSSSVG
jgi:hypothetical protein